MEHNEREMKVEIPGDHHHHRDMSFSPRGSSHGLTRQPSTGSSAKGNCLCSPTTHAGSFRCRLHRAPSLQRTKSMDPASSKPDVTDDNSNSASSPSTANTSTIIHAQ